MRENAKEILDRIIRRERRAVTTDFISHMMKNENRIKSELGSIIDFLLDQVALLRAGDTLLMDAVSDSRKECESFAEDEVEGEEHQLRCGKQLLLYIRELKKKAKERDESSANGGDGADGVGGDS